LSALAPRSVLHHASLQPPLPASVKRERRGAAAVFGGCGAARLWRGRAARQGRGAHVLALHAGAPGAAAKRSQGGPVGRW